MDEVIALQCFMFSDRQSSVFGAVFVVHILQKCLLVLGSIRSLVIRIDINSLVPFPKRSQLAKRIKNVCRNKKHTHRWRDFGIVFGQLLSRKRHSEVSIFLPLGFLLSQSSQNAIHIIEHVIIDGDNMMQCDCMSFRHPQSPVSESH